MVEWNSLNWRQIQRRVFKLQTRIFKASQRGDFKAVRKLQKLLIRSWSARCLAVRRVTQDNQGKKTAGVDGVKSLTPKARLALTKNLRISEKAKPMRRVWIAKPGTQEKRPLGIPTMTDRARQALLTLALEPEWEARFEPNSYGFRPGRSCHDALQAIYNAIRQQSKFVLDADIAKCFDRIDQQALLKKMNTSSAIRRQIRAWLKAGVMEGSELFPTPTGTPQGGVISPLLANIALHGMEERVKQVSKMAQLIRYADDFVCIHTDQQIVQSCQTVLEEWLAGMGLELKPSKTRIAHTLLLEEGQPGFDFLGFTVRQFPVGKYHTGTNSRGKPLGFKTIIKPSKKSIKTHTEKLRRIIHKHKAQPQSFLIEHLNPIIRGWTHFFSKVVSGATFKKLDRTLYMQLKAWATSHHRNQSQKWLARKYWLTIGTQNWCFAVQKGEGIKRLVQHSDRPITRHVKVKERRSPYDGDWVYWSNRIGQHPQIKAEVARLLKSQTGKCTHCGLYFMNGELLEVDHRKPKRFGGRNISSNKQLLHRHCHHQKTAAERIQQLQSQSRITEAERLQLQAKRQALLEDYQPYKSKKRLTDAEWMQQWH
ncbi:group II intron reverse transcriptase/maturase [Gloeobacter violaceus]|uniref:Gll0177 protein n=1 Tax=Gloeobacter violaceus (strain ATCC 29082 / PCC 7421) TaxID=251221 RepID=Q7NP80_GLOVI|nr:group II intron reverse transcriptase/maturase [Gloeobacter violaceus]BAC88118.1 gll0177 [Gloeobacter violaceus PCC 7421]